MLESGSFSHEGSEILFLKVSSAFPAPWLKVLSTATIIQIYHGQEFYVCCIARVGFSASFRDSILWLKEGWRWWCSKFRSAPPLAPHFGGMVAARRRYDI